MSLLQWTWRVQSRLDVPMSCRVSTMRLSAPDLARPEVRRLRHLPRRSTHRSTNKQHTLSLCQQRTAMRYMPWLL